MKKEMIKILINGKFYYEVDKPEDVLLSFFQRDIDIYSLMSIDAIKQRITSTIELINELESILTMKTKKFIKTIEDTINRIDKKDVLIGFIINFILTKEGLGLLHGFGCATVEKASKGKQKVKTMIRINPEKQPIKVIKQ